MENVDKEKHTTQTEVHNDAGEINYTNQKLVNDSTKTKSKDTSSFMCNFLHVLTVFGIGFLLFTFIFQIWLKPISIMGRSMQPTLNIESTGSTDNIHCDQVYYKTARTYNKGDIIIADSKNFMGDEGLIIKRIIATAGDTLSFEFDSDVETYRNVAENKYTYVCYYTLFLNGEKLVEDYIKEQKCYITFTTSATGIYNDDENFDFIKLMYDKFYINDALSYIHISPHDNTISITLKNNQYFICGDNRNNSTDSRYFGAINKEDIVGVVVIHIPYGYNLITYIWYKITSKYALFA